MTFRHPLRNEWDQVKPQFEIAAALDNGAEAVIARAMLDIMPAFLAIIERERDKGTPAEHKFAAFFSVIGMLAENAIEASFKTRRARREALTRLLQRLDRVVGERLSKPASVATSNGLLLPGGF